MIFLKFTTEIKGDASVSGYEDQIKLTSVSFSANRTVASVAGSSARETGSPAFTELNCSKDFDIASTELFMQSVSGASLQGATLTYLQTDNEGNPQVYLTVTLVDPIVTSYSQSSSGDRKPSENFTLNFTEIKMAYTKYDGDSAKKATEKGWNLSEQKAA